MSATIQPKHLKEPPQMKELWRAFCDDLELHRKHNISQQELDMLARVALIGSLKSKEDLLFILSVMRGERHS